MPNTPQSAFARAEQMLSQWKKAPTQVRKSAKRTVRRVENSVAALAAALSGAVPPPPRKAKGGARKKMTRRMSSTKSKRMTRRK